LRGVHQDVIFHQVNEPGRMRLSDFTGVAEHALTLAGQFLNHRLMPAPISN